MDLQFNFGSFSDCTASIQAVSTRGREYLATYYNLDPEAVGVEAVKSSASGCWAEAINAGLIVGR